MGDFGALSARLVAPAMLSVRRSPAGAKAERG